MRLAYLGWVLCLLIGAPGMALAEPLPVVNIRVVDLTEIGRDRIVDSLDVTRSLFRSVDIAVAWTYCSGTSDDCSTPLEANEVWLRIVPGHATQDGWARKWVSTRALGFSNLDADPDAAIMSTVFAGQVTRLARAARTSSRTLLGQVSAHEIAHLLMGTMNHTNTGLMAERWSTRAASRARHFSADVGIQLRAAVLRRDRSRQHPVVPNESVVNSRLATTR